MANPRITNASVRRVLVEANGRLMSSQHICAALGVAWSLEGDGWQNVCEVLWEATRLTELGIAQDKPCIGWRIEPAREVAHG